jgi:hypothetical protein
MEFLHNICKITFLITWSYCPGLAGVHGNKEADRLAVSAPVAGQIPHDRRDVIKTLWVKHGESQKTQKTVHRQDEADASGKRVWKTFISARES